MDSNYHALSFSADQKIDLELLEDHRVLGGNADLENNQYIPKKSFPQSNWVWLAHGLLLLTSFSFCLRGYLYSSPTTQRFIEKFSIYSSASSAIEYKDVQFDGNMSPTSPYVGSGPAVDAAWAAISSDVGHFIVPASTLPKIGKSPAASRPVYDSETGAVTGYHATLDVFHQLSCLDTLRQATYPSEQTKLQLHDEEEAKNVLRAEAQRVRLDHCIETLRQNLMCSSDVGLVTFQRKMESDSTGFPVTPKNAEPDYSTWHTCRNFDRVLDWAMEHKMKMADA